MTIKGGPLPPFLLLKTPLFKTNPSRVITGAYQLPLVPGVSLYVTFSQAGYTWTEPEVRSGGHRGQGHIPRRLPGGTLLQNAKVRKLSFFVF